MGQLMNAAMFAFIADRMYYLHCLHALHGEMYFPVQQLFMVLFNGTLKSPDVSNR